MNSETKRRFSLVQKLVASYALILLFTATALLFAVGGLYSLSKTAKGIVVTDLPAIGSTTKLRELMLAQERYAGKFLILGEAEFHNLFQQKSDEFGEALKSLPYADSDPLVTALSASYRRYLEAVNTVFQAGNKNRITPRNEAEKVLAAIDDLTAHQREILVRKLTDTKEREANTIKMAVMLSSAGFILALVVAAFFGHTVSSSIRGLKTGTHRIAAGDFEFDPRIPTGDEIGDLAQDFMLMARKLKELEQMNLDASPLTRLPGNIAIERTLTQRIRERTPFAVIYSDLDSFKAFNDRYGYIKGSEVIKHTSEVIQEAVWTIAGTNPFIGHVGGDDFVIVVHPDKAAPVCERIVENFSKMIITYYSAADLSAGGIEGIDRYGVHRTFPIMSISLAVLVCQEGAFSAAAEIAETATKIMVRLKDMPGSNFLIHHKGTSR